MKLENALSLFFYTMGGSIGLAVLSISIYRRRCPGVGLHPWQWQRRVGLGLAWLLIAIGNFLARW